MVIIAVYLRISSVIFKSGIFIPAINLPNIIKRNVVIIILINKVFDFNLAVKKPDY